MTDVISERLQKAYDAIRQAGGSTSDATEMKAFCSRHEAGLTAIQEKAIKNLADAARVYSKRKDEIDAQYMRDLFDANEEWARHLEDVLNAIHKRHLEGPQRRPLNGNFTPPELH